ncbi:DUF4258 domain-containing protein [Cyclonatronum proteinivorum]|uniref:DUF4258 domain-containing protein n=1 Tax=Cyclonatronum proteinivorum TaxID=1457365 RepID=UPI000E0EADF0
MALQFSKHAIERLSARGIQKELVLEVLQTPDTIIEESNCVRIFQKLDVQKGNSYLIRVFVNVCKEPKLIITAYRTSKVNKYDH